MAIDGPLGTPAIDAFERNVSDLDRAINGDDNVTARPVGGNTGKTLLPYTQIVSVATVAATEAAASATEAADSASSINVPPGATLWTSVSLDIQGENGIGATRLARANTSGDIYLPGSTIAGSSLSELDFDTSGNARFTGSLTGSWILTSGGSASNEASWWTRIL